MIYKISNSLNSEYWILVVVVYIVVKKLTSLRVCSGGRDLEFSPKKTM